MELSNNNQFIRINRKISGKFSYWINRASILLILIFLIFDDLNVINVNFHAFHLLVFLFVIATLLLINKAAIHNRRESVLLYYVLGYCVFHFGIVPVYLVSPKSIDELGFNLFMWYSRTESVKPAYMLALIYLAGVICSLSLPMIRVNDIIHYKPKNSNKLVQISLVSLIFFIIAWCYIVLTSGIGGYDILLAGLKDSGLGAFIGLIHTGISVTFLLAVALSERPRSALIVFGIWGLLAFPLGLRGEVAFPALLGLSFLQAQGRFTLNPLKFTLLALIFLAFSSVVSVYRISTAQDTLENSISIARGIAELGGSIRPAYEVVEWLNTGDSLQWGLTYLAPFERTILGIFPLSKRIPAELDFRLMNILIENRAGPYGFSIAAEAFYNFGYIGCLIVGLLTGWSTRFAGRLAERKIFNPIVLALVFSLFIHIRQSFVSSYGVFMIGVIILSTLWLATKIKINSRS